MRGIEPALVSLHLSVVRVGTYQAATAIIKYIIIRRTPSSQWDFPSAMR